MALDAGAVGDETNAAALRVGVRRPGPHHVRLVAGADELVRRPERHQLGRKQAGAVVTAHRVEELVDVVPQRIGRVRALVKLREEVARDSDPGAPTTAGALELDVVLPLDLVPDVVLVADGRAGVDGRVVHQRLVREAERDPAPPLGPPGPPASRPPTRPRRSGRGCGRARARTSSARRSRDRRPAADAMSGRASRLGRPRSRSRGARPGRCRPRRAPRFRKRCCGDAPPSRRASR